MTAGARMFPTCVLDITALFHWLFCKIKNIFLRTLPLLIYEKIRYEKKCKMWYWMINNLFCIPFSDADVLFIRFSYPEWVSPSSLRFSFSLFCFPVRYNQQDWVTNSYIVIVNHGNMVLHSYIQSESWKCRIFSSSTKCCWTFFKIYTKTKQNLTYTVCNDTTNIFYIKHNIYFSLLVLSLFDIKTLSASWSSHIV